MDLLTEVAEDDLGKLRDYLGNNWPYGVEGYCILSTQLSHVSLTKAHNFKFYSPRGEICHGMVAVSDTEHYYEVFICPTSTSGMTIIEDALITTNKIDWNREVTVSSANSDVFESLKRLRDKLGLKIVYENKVCKHLLHKGTKPFEHLDPPEDTYVGPITSEHLNLVNTTWTFCSGEHSYEMFKVLMENGLTYALYSSKDNTPVAWITVDSSGAFTHLYCLDTHRKKGYAEYITKVATNDLLKQRMNVLVYTLKENFKPQNLFNKLGFEFVGHVWWIRFTKK